MSDTLPMPWIEACWICDCQEPKITGITGMTKGLRCPVCGYSTGFAGSLADAQFEWNAYHAEKRIALGMERKAGLSDGGEA
jgi:hypothetical protein